MTEVNGIKQFLQKKKKKKEKEKVFKYLVKLTGKQMHYRRDSCIDVFL